MVFVLVGKSKVSMLTMAILLLLHITALRLNYMYNNRCLLTLLYRIFKLCIKQGHNDYHITIEYCGACCAMHYNEYN